MSQLFTLVWERPLGIQIDRQWQTVMKSTINLFLSQNLQTFQEDMRNNAKFAAQEWIHKLMKLDRLLSNGSHLQKRLENVFTQIDQSKVNYANYKEISSQTQQISSLYCCR